MTEKRPIDANDLMARFFRKECLMQGHSAAASAAYKLSLIHISEPRRH